MEEVRTTLAPLIELFRGQPWLQALAVALVSLAVAVVLTWILKNLLLRLARYTRFELDDQIVAIIRPPLFYSILMLGLSVAIGLLPVGAKFQQLILNAFQTLGILIWSLFGLRLARLLLRAWAATDMRMKLVRPQTLPLFENLAFFAVLGVAIYLAFQAWGIDMTAWLASAGVMGVAIGFAAKDTLSNFISGIFILADAPYKIGDYVLLDSGERGEITNIGIRSTRMLTRDDVELTIPNAVMGTTKVINQSGGPHEKFRVRVPVGVAYGSDIDQVRAILQKVGEEHSLTCGLPEPRVRLRAFGASSLDFELLCWVDNPALRGRAVDGLLTDIYKRFTAAGVEIPYTKQDLYIKEMPH